MRNNGAAPIFVVLLARRKSIAVLATVFVIGVVVTCLFLRKAQARTTVFGETDPESGLRCRITLSADWKLQVRLSEASNLPRFVAPAPNPLQRWIDSHLLHRSPSNPPTVALGLAPLSGFRGFCLRDGYPEFVQFPDRYLTAHRHLRIDGYPATLMVHNYPMIPSERVTLLLVSVPEHAMIYTLYGASEPSNADRLDREMEAIISSYHIEKVAAPAAGKR